MARFGVNVPENMEEVKMEPIQVDSADRAKEVEFLKKCSGDELKQMFRDYREGDRATKLGMTEEEANRINDCMGKDEFMDLFREYVDDISDPKNQEEYDQYLRQLEEEGEIPENEEIVRPTPGFVVKTKSTDVGSKIFVNICGTPKVPKPSQGGRAAENCETTGSMGDGATNGNFWSIPYIHTSMRMDQDKDRNPCHVYDILFNDDTIKLAETQGPRFKLLVIQTALESVEENGKVKLKNAEGNFDFNIMTKMTYKGQVVRPHKLKKDVLEQPKAPSHPPEKPKPKPVPKKKVEEIDPSKPKMTVVHRGEIELGDYMKCVGMRDLPISRRPKELVIKLELPLMKSAADMELDIKGGFLEFKAEKAGYNLKHKLPYPVNEDTGDAKYVKAQKLLTVTLEVLPWEKEEVEAEIARAEAALAAQQAEAHKKKEEEERKAAEDAKRVVKKGFLDANNDKKAKKPSQPTTIPVSDQGGSDSVAAASLALSDLSLGGSGESSEKGEEGGNLLEAKRPNIEDLGECVPAEVVERGGVAAAAAVAEEVEGGEPFVSFRQNQKNVTAVVRVVGVEENSVLVDIQQTRVHMKFSSLCPAESGTDGALKRINYAHTLDLSEDVDPVHSRYDVSDTNLVLVLRKVNDTRWNSFTGAPRDTPPPPAVPPVDAAAEAEKAKAAAAAAEEASQKEGDGKHVRFGGEMGPTGDKSSGECAAGCCGAAAAGNRQAGCDESTPEVRRVEGANGEVFESADAYGGSRPGMVYKMGQLGLGYYTDKPLHTQVSAKEEEETHPTKLAPDPAPKVAPKQGEEWGADKPPPKLPFNNTLLYDLD